MILFVVYAAVERRRSGHIDWEAVAAELRTSPRWALAAIAPSINEADHAAANDSDDAAADDAPPQRPTATRFNKAFSGISAQDVHRIWRALAYHGRPQQLEQFAPPEPEPEPEVEPAPEPLHDGAMPEAMKPREPEPLHDGAKPEAQCEASPPKVPREASPPCTGTPAPPPSQASGSASRSESSTRESPLAASPSSIRAAGDAPSVDDHERLVANDVARENDGYDGERASYAAAAAACKQAVAVATEAFEFATQHPTSKSAREAAEALADAAALAAAEAVEARRCLPEGERRVTGHRTHSNSKRAAAASSSGSRNAPDGAPFAASCGQPTPSRRELGPRPPFPEALVDVALSESGSDLEDGPPSRIRPPSKGAYSRQGPPPERPVDWPEHGTPRMRNRKYPPPPGVPKFVVPADGSGPLTLDGVCLPERDDLADKARDGAAAQHKSQVSRASELIKNWTEAEERKLVRAVERHGITNRAALQKTMGRSWGSIFRRIHKLKDNGLIVEKPAPADPSAPPAAATAGGGGGAAGGAAANGCAIGAKGASAAGEQGGGKQALDLYPELRRDAISLKIWREARRLKNEGKQFGKSQQVTVHGWDIKVNYCEHKTIKNKNEAYVYVYPPELPGHKPAGKGAARGTIIKSFVVLRETLKQHYEARCALGGPSKAAG